METLKKYQHFFGVLAVAKPDLCKSLLFKADDAVITAIIEVIMNILNGNLKLGDQDVNKLKKHRVILRKIATRKKNKKKNPLPAQRKRLIQYGKGFLPIICTAALNGIHGDDSH